MINCVNSIFKNYDYHNNLIKESILNIFKGLYGKNVKDFILKIDIKRRILILNRLKDRQIGKMKDVF